MDGLKLYLIGLLLFGIVMIIIAEVDNRKRQKKAHSER